jgi:hypothetical protein
MAAALGAMVQLAAASNAAKAHEQAGQDRARAYKEQAEQAESAAKDRELERLVKIRRTLSSQRAYWAGAGIDASMGSPTTVAARSYETFELDQGADLINTRQQIRSFNNSADAAVRMGKIKARGSILGGVMGAANTWNT